MRHRAVLKGLDQARPPFRDVQSIDLADPEFGTGLEARVNLTPCLQGDASGYLAYIFRNPDYVRDKAEFDDRLIVDTPTNDFDIDELADCLRDCVIACDAYRAGVETDQDWLLDDWEMICALAERTGKDEDGRDTVCRILPVAYFDRELCRRAFSLSPEQIHDLLTGHVHRVEIVHDGVLILSSPALLVGDQIAENDLRLRGLLGVPSMMTYGD